MRYFKITLAILGLILSFVTMGANNSTTNTNGKAELVGATFTARVISPKAVVYADENMLSPLGYIANGKAILVGNPRRMNRELVPLVVYGKLAFIEIKDIRYEDTEEDEYSLKRGAPREHNFDLIIEKPPENLLENNSFFFSLHRYDAGTEVKEAFYANQGLEEGTMSGFQAQFIHRQKHSNFFWGTSFDYSSASTADMRFAYWLFSPTVGFTPIKNPLFLIDIYGSIDLALNTQIAIENNFASEPTAFLWGPQLNARIVFFPNSKYHILGGLGIRKYSVSGASELEDSTGKITPGITKVSGASLFIGLGMEFN